MNKKISIFVFIALLLVSGCTNKEAAKEAPMSGKLSAVMPAGFAPEKEKSRGEAGGELKRYMAIQHHLVVETDEAELPKAWEAVNEFCRTLGCDIVESGISQQIQDTPPSGSLIVRVVPKDLKPLLEHVGKVTHIVTHTMESEDKTATVIDVDAKMKNLTELRNRLRSMLATRTGNLKDVVEVERELSRVQSELDSLTATRKVLANETDKVAVTIDFRSKQSIAGIGAFAPVVSAWHEIGHIFASSIAMVMTFIVAIVPWLALIVPAVWFLPRLLRRLFRKKTK